MVKILLDLRQRETPQEIQEYLAFRLDFPKYYGKNLDALYDMLTEIGEDTCLGVFTPPGETVGYLSGLCRVFRDAEEENPHLCVFFGNWEENRE
jgi:ribonuclease inhibitor